LLYYSKIHGGSAHIDKKVIKMQGFIVTQRGSSSEDSWFAQKFMISSVWFDEKSIEIHRILIETEKIISEAASVGSAGSVICFIEGFTL
jgi:hypothetical protein